MKLISKKNNLIMQVHRAFEDVKPPTVNSGVEITFSFDTERQDLAVYLFEKHWKYITSETLIRDNPCQLDSILFFLTEHGFHFYFPAFLIMSLDVEIQGDDDTLREAAFIPFANYFYNDDNGFYRRRFELFSSQQLQVIDAVFKYVREVRRQELIEELGLVGEVVIHRELEVIDNAVNGVQKVIFEGKGNTNF